MTNAVSSPARPNSTRARAAVILAAGQGTRMKSPTPKVLHKVGGRTLLDHAIDTAQALGCERIVVVVGAHSPQVGEHARKRLGEGATVLQDPPQGTGHAVLAAKAALADFDGDVVVTYADCPLLSAPTIEPLFDLRAKGADVAVLGFEAAHPGAYGRLILAPAMCCCASSRPRTPTTRSSRSSTAIPASWPPTAPCCSTCWPMSATTTPTRNIT
jgi:bifunctional UDP-N-acetylglucosamine pyrophosphorylase/glucosamine-1-phosphate N-acetyltransferase